MKYNKSLSIRTKRKLSKKIEGFKLDESIQQVKKATVNSQPDVKKLVKSLAESIDILYKIVAEDQLSFEEEFNQYTDSVIDYMNDVEDLNADAFKEDVDGKMTWGLVYDLEDQPVNLVTFTLHEGTGDDGTTKYYVSADIDYLVDTETKSIDFSTNDFSNPYDAVLDLSKLLVFLRDIEDNPDINAVYLFLQKTIERATDYL